MSLVIGMGIGIPFFDDEDGDMAFRRPSSLPTMSGTQPPNLWYFWDDFVAGQVGVAPAAEGHPAWQVTSIAGTGTVGMMTHNTGQGTLQTTTGANANDGYMVDLGGFGVNNAGSIQIANPRTTKHNIMTRFQWNSPAVVTNVINGVGFVNTFNLATGVATGTNWVTDPLTTLAGKSAFIVHRSSASYGQADGVTYPIGSVMLYRFDSVGTTAVKLLDAPVTGGDQMTKVEWAMDGTTGRVYLNNVLVDSFTQADLQSSQYSLRPTLGVQTLGAAARTWTVDCFYGEMEGLYER